jgi:hypothetical protein
MEDVDSTVFHLLLGSAFSLWRAAFLVKGTRQRSDLNEHALEFLDKLLWDNAINYPQDRDTHAWTGGYYVNSAALRLREAGTLLQMTGSAEFQALGKFISQQWDQPKTTLPDVGEGWDICHAAGKGCLTMLRKR